MMNTNLTITEDIETITTRKMMKVAFAYIVAPTRQITKQTSRITEPYR